MPMKKLLTAFVLTALLLLPAASAAGDEGADALNRLGLFSGSEAGYELDRTPTRAEALVMLLKLTGQADEALAGEWSHPFQDAGWASSYIGYAYQNGLTAGVSDDMFGTSQNATAQQYAAFLLRALGYQEFDYENALTLLQTSTPAVLPQGEGFTRGDLVDLSLAALAAPVADGSGTLAARLAGEGLFDYGDYQAARDSVGAQEAAQTTVLIYVTGSNLERTSGRATADIEEMLQAELTGNINIVLQTGGTKAWKNDWMTDGATQRFTIQNGTVQPASPVLEGVLMSQPETLANFLRWGVTSYPAQRYILVLWNHGGGTLRGYGHDEMNNDKTLMLDELDQAFTWADVDFALVGFDACLMATMSTSCMLKDHSSYLLASEELEPVNGWYYTDWLTMLDQDPDMEVRPLAEAIADGYLTDALKEDWLYATISLIDLSRIDAVADGWREVADQLCQRLQEGRYADVEQVLRQSKAYGQGTSYDQVDMTDFLTRAENAGLATTGELRRAVSEAVVYRTGTPLMDRSNGLALYIPYEKYARYQEKVRKALLGSGFQEEVMAFWDEFYSLVKKNGPTKLVWPKNR